MRLRLPELLDAKGMTAYRLHKEAGTLADGSPRISLSTAYRLVRLEGKLETFGAVILDALCDVLGVEPGELLERTAPETAPKDKKPRAR